MTLKKVVVIDDENDMCLIIKKVLEGTGKYNVVIANDGLQGKELCVSEKPDIVLLDFVLPKESGEKIFLFLKENPATAHIPVIFMSGLDKETCFKTVEAFMSSKGEKEKKFDVQCLSKPFSKEVLLTSVNQIFEK